MSSPVHRRTSSIHTVLLLPGKHLPSISPSIVATTTLSLLLSWAYSNNVHGDLSSKDFTLLFTTRPLAPTTATEHTAAQRIGSVQRVDDMASTGPRQWTCHVHTELSVGLYATQARGNGKYKLGGQARRRDRDAEVVEGSVGRGISPPHLTRGFGGASWAPPAGSGVEPRRKKNIWCILTPPGGRWWQNLMKLSIATSNAKTVIFIHIYMHNAPIVLQKRTPLASDPQSAIWKNTDGWGKIG